MGASASASLPDSGCCSSSRDDELLAATSGAVAADEVVRPEGEHAAVKTLVSPALQQQRSGTFQPWKSKSALFTSKKAVLRSVPSDEAIGLLGEDEEEAANLGSPQQDQAADSSEGDVQAAGQRSPSGGPDARILGPAAHQRFPSTTLGTLQTVEPEQSHNTRTSQDFKAWQKPKDAACAALRYLGLLASGPLSPANVGVEDFAAEMLELSLSICAASAADINGLTKAAGREDRRALRRLAELASRAGLLKRNSPAFGSLTLLELAQAFIRGSGAGQDEDGHCGGELMGRRPSRSASSLGSMSRIPTNKSIDSKDGGSQFLQMRRRLSSKQSDHSKGEQGPQTLSQPQTLSHLARTQGLNRSMSNLSNNPGFARTASDFSITSCSDFNRRMQQRRPAAVRAASRQDLATAAPSFIEFLTVVEKQTEGVDPVSRAEDTSTEMVMDIQLPCRLGASQAAQHSGASAVGGIAMAGVWQSEGAMTYHSACDAVFQSEGEEKEVVQAEVLNLSASDEGASRVRIAFRSRCLRTQNEWQRQLLAQQRDLLHIASTKLQAAERVLKQGEEVKEEQKALLRGFRKIIARELSEQDMSHNTSIYVVEKREDLRAEIKELCRILEYRCECFKHIALAKKAISGNALEAIPSRNPSVESCGRALLEGRPGSEGQDWRSRAFHKATSDGADISPEAPLRILFLSSTWLERGLPDLLKDAADDVMVVLTSEAEDFEEVGRILLASGEAEIRERLRARGISEYLLYPLSLESLQAVIAQALNRRLGNEYLLLETVGRGTTGIVHQAKRLKDGMNFALKEINTRRLSRTAKQDVERETQLLQELSWPTVVFVVDSWESKADHLRFLLMPLLQGGNLLQRTEAAAANDSEKVPRERVAAWYAQTLHGLTYLHWRGVLHRDLKPGNILLADDGLALQIGDLGSAALLPGPGPHPSKRSVVRGSVCTPAYGSPEVLNEGTFMSASDVWSVGATFYEVMTLQPLIPPNTAFNEIKDLVSVFDPESPGSEPESQVPNLAGKALATLRDSQMGAPAAELTELLRQDPLRRPTAAALANRPATAHRLRNALAQGALPGPEEQTAHFELFRRVLTESEAAADLPPPPETPKEESATRRRRAMAHARSSGAV